MAFLRMYIYIGWPGKVHDAQVFANSRVFKHGNEWSLFSDWKNTSGVQVNEIIC